MKLRLVGPAERPMRGPERRPPSSILAEREGRGGARVAGEVAVKVFSLRLLLGMGLAMAAVLAGMPAAGHAQAALLAPLLEEPSPMVGRSNSTHGYLGVDVADVDQGKAQALKLQKTQGALITLIDHDAPAGHAGLRVNDVVLQMNGQTVENAGQLRRMLREIPPGRKVSLEISREGTVRTVEVELADRQAIEHDIWDRIWSGVDVFPTTSPRMGMLSDGSDAPAGSRFHIPFFGSSLNVGAIVEPLTSQMAEYLGVTHGVMVKRVARKSEAAAAGLRAFDVILNVNAESIATTADWDRSLRANRGKPVQVTVLRGKKQQVLTLQVDSKHHGAIGSEKIFPEHGKRVGELNEEGLERDALVEPPSEEMPAMTPVNPL